jgi:hypothetical protein
VTAPLCFLDTETDGVHPGRKPWEIAIVRREPDGLEHGMEIFVEIDLASADPSGLRVGRFYERHPLGRYLAGDGPDRPEVYDLSGDYRSRAKAAELVARWTHGAHIVGAVPNFDTETLAPLLREHGLLPAWHYHLIDIEALAVGWVAHKAKTIREERPDIQLEPWPPLPWKSDDLGRAVGVEPATAEERHTAMGDVRWVMRMYEAIMGGAK